MLKPFDYQQICLRRIQQHRQQKKKALVVMASGLGKTITSAFDIKRWLNKNPNSKVLYLCHQNDILSQASFTFRSIVGGSETKYGYYHGYKKSRQAQFLFASFQTMRRKFKRFDRKEFDYIVVDESHHVPAATYAPVVRYFKPKFLLGMTATPDRTDMQDIRNIFGDEVFTMPLSEALANGLLTPVDYRLLTDEIVELGKVENPYKMSLAELNKKIFAPKRDKEIVEIIKRKIATVKNPRVMIFCPSIRYTEELRKRIQNAVPVHSGLQRKEQETRINEFKKGSTNIILTVDKFNEGIDIPEVNVVVFLRSTQSKTVFYQQLGRGLRKVHGKNKVLVLDFIANCDRLLMVNEFVESTQKNVRKRSGVGEYKPKETLVVNGGSFRFTEKAKNVLDVLEKVKTGYTPEVLIEQLRNEAKLLKRTPVSNDVKKAQTEGRMVSVHTYQRMFGSWNNALKMANLSSEKPRFSKKELAQQLRTEAQLLKKIPSGVDINKSSVHGRTASTQTFLNVFGTWHKALKAAKLHPKGKERKHYLKNELIQQIINVSKDLKRTPRFIDIQEFSKKRITASTTMFISVFGSWKEALKKAGFKDLFKKENLLQQLNNESKILKRIPTIRDIKKSHAAKRTASHSVFQRRFGTWRKALKAAKLI